MSLERSIIDKIKTHENWLIKKRLDTDEPPISPVDFRRCNLSNNNLIHILKEKDLSYCDFTYSNLTGIDCEQAHFNMSDFSISIMRNVDFRSTMCYKTRFDYVVAAHSNFINSDMKMASMHSGDFSYSDFTNASLFGANLEKCNLSNTILKGVDLRFANLTGAYLSGADLSDIKYNEYTKGLCSACPEEGSFIAYKCAYSDKFKDKALIVKLHIPEYAKRSSATTRKCRCSQAKVIDIIDENGEHFKSAHSGYDDSFVYYVNETVKVDDFDEDRWRECSTGIHFFMTKDEAVQYAMQ